VVGDDAKHNAEVFNLGVMFFVAKFTFLWSNVETLDECSLCVGYPY